jgi:hypothetical protein
MIWREFLCGAAMISHERLYGAAMILHERFYGAGVSKAQRRQPGCETWAGVAR